MKTPNKRLIGTDANLTAEDLIPLPNPNSVFPFKIPVMLTRRLWQALFERKEVERNALSEDLCAYTLFAVLGLTGFNRQQTAGTRTMLIPVAFASGKSIVRLTSHRRGDDGKTLTLSLPEERWPF